MGDRPDGLRRAVLPLHAVLTRAVDSIPSRSSAGNHPKAQSPGHCGGPLSGIESRSQVKNCICDLAGSERKLQIRAGPCEDGRVNHGAFELKGAGFLFFSHSEHSARPRHLGGCRP